MEKIIKNIIVFGLLVLPLTALITVDSMFFPFITGKAFFFRVFVEFLTALYVCLAIHNKQYRPQFSYILVSFASFVLVMFIADIFAISPVKALWSNFERMEGFVTLVHLLMYFVVLNGVLRTQDDWRKMILSTSSVAVFMTFFSLLQFFGGAVINQGGLRLDGTIGNSAYLATYFVFHIFFLLFLWVRDGNKFKGIEVSFLFGSVMYVMYYLIQVYNKKLAYSAVGGWILVTSFLLSLCMCWFRWFAPLRKFENKFIPSFFVALIVAELFVLYHTATRGAILGLIGGLFISAFFVLWKERENKSVRYIGIGIIIFLLSMAGLFLLFRDSEFVSKSPVLSRFASISWNESKTQARSYVWPMAIKAFAEHPVIGWGQDNFIFAFSKYYTPEMIRHEPWFDRTHNVFLDWLVAGGILGLLGYLALYVFSLKNILKNPVFSQRERAVLVGLLVAYAFLSLFIFDNLISYMLFIFLIALASSKDDIAKNKLPPRYDVAKVLIVLAVFVAVLYLINYSPYIQNKRLTQALSAQSKGIQENYRLFDGVSKVSPVGEYESIEQMVRFSTEVIASDAVDNQTKNNFAILTINTLNDFLTKNSTDPRVFSLFGNFLADIGAYDDALPLLNQAMNLSPLKQQNYYSLARVYFAKGTKDKKKEYIDQGLQFLKNAYELAPNMDNPKLIYINALLFLGDIKEAGRLIDSLENPGYLIDMNLMGPIAEKLGVSRALQILKHIREVDGNKVDAVDKMIKTLESLQKK